VGLPKKVKGGKHLKVSRERYQFVELTYADRPYEQECAANATGIII